MSTITLPLSTVKRLLAVLDDAQQVYGTLDEAGLATDADRADAATLDAALCDLSRLRAVAANV